MLNFLEIAEEFGTPCFVYDLSIIDRQIALIGAAFGDRFAISYAMKSNPNSVVVRELMQRIPFLDVSSGGELRSAIALGWPANAISFTGPAKTERELLEAVTARVADVVVESLDEARDLDRIAAGKSVVQPILIRIAPQRMPAGFGVKMAGKPSQFGIDEETLADVLPQIRALRNVHIDGFHIYSGTQSLKPPAIAENYSIYIDIFKKAAQLIDLSPRKLVFGSGLGIPYHEGDVPLDIAALASAVNPIIDSLKTESRFAATACLLETGRYIVGESGTYLTRVVRVKESRGTSIAICDGGMNHHLGACGHLGTIIHRNYQMFAITSSIASPPIRTYDLVGPLCTTIDTLGHRVRLPEMRVGDLVAVRCSGAYGLSASPVNFISHDPAREIVIDSRDSTASPRDASDLRNERVATGDLA